jgi:hypothetical protein
MGDGAGQQPEGRQLFVYKSKDTIIYFGHASDPESLESATAKGTLPFG